MINKLQHLLLTASTDHDIHQIKSILNTEKIDYKYLIENESLLDKALKNDFITDNYRSIVSDLINKSILPTSKESFHKIIQLKLVQMYSYSEMKMLYAINAQTTSNTEFRELLNNDFHRELLS